MENFDQLALTWDNDPRRMERAKVVAEEIIKAVPYLDKMDGFEYGCGTGLLSFNLQSHLKMITLGDSSQGMLEVLKQKIEKTKSTNMIPVKMDLTKDEPLSKEQFDIIYTLLTLHHIPEVDKVIEEFSQILRRPGYVCIADLDEEDGSFHGEEFSGHHGFNKNILSEKLMRYGFEVISWKICYENEKKLADGSFRKYPLFIMVAKKL